MYINDLKENLFLPSLLFILIAFMCTCSLLYQVLHWIGKAGIHFKTKEIRILASKTSFSHLIKLSAWCVNFEVLICLIASKTRKWSREPEQIACVSREKHLVELCNILVLIANSFTHGYNF